jgi:hypothetical protein
MGRDATVPVFTDFALSLLTLAPDFKVLADNGLWRCDPSLCSLGAISTQGRPQGGQPWAIENFPFREAAEPHIITQLIDRRHYIQSSSRVRPKGLELSDARVHQVFKNSVKPIYSFA